MFFFLINLFFACFFSSAVSSLPSQFNGQLVQRRTALPLPVNVIHQFPSPTWLENLAIRSNSGGDVLCTALTTPDLFIVDPTTGVATLLHRFPSVEALSGITQIGHDIFYVAGGNYSLASQTSTPGSYEIFQVDIRGYDEHGTAGVKVKEVVTVKESLLLNGLTRLDSASKTLLVADSIVGAVFEVDVETGMYKLGIDLPEMKGSPSAGSSLGVNGIKVKDGYLYFTNSAMGTLSRVAIDTATGAVSGAVELLASGITPDDFVIGKGGLIWIAQNSQNKISVLLKNGTVIDVAGSPDSLLVPGPTACEFGRKDKLYCASTGGLASMVKGTFVGGELLEIDTANVKL